MGETQPVFCDRELLNRMLHGPILTTRKRLEFFRRLGMEKYSHRALMITHLISVVFSRDNSNIVRLSVAPSGEELVPGRVEVAASSAEMGDNAGQLDGSVEGEETQIAFNVRYLRDALEAVSSGEVALEITGPTSPGLAEARRGRWTSTCDHADARFKMSKVGGSNGRTPVTIATSMLDRFSELMQ